MNSEQAYMEMEAARIDSSEQYFKARPQIDCTNWRLVYESGFDRGWKAALNSQTKSVPDDDATEIRCPTCGYYCSGKGGIGCIDKPSLVAAPQPQEDKVRELEKELELFRAATPQALHERIAEIMVVAKAMKGE